MERWAVYLDVIISQCLPSAPGSAPGFMDYVLVATIIGLASWALWSLAKGFCGRDGKDAERIKAAVLDDQS